MPDDSSERYVLLNRLADEIAVRYRRGERPSLQEYIVLEDLVLLAQLLSAKRVDSMDGLIGVEPADQRRALERLRPRYPTDFAVSFAETLAWHQREAEACVREQNRPAALFHLLHSPWGWSVFTGGLHGGREGG
jgi:hypothetical protein